MIKRKIIPFLVHVFGAIAVLSVVFPMIQIDIAKIYFAPTLVSISDISSFFQSLDISRVFGSLHLEPLIANVKVSLPLIGETKLSDVLLLFSMCQV